MATILAPACPDPGAGPLRPKAQIMPAPRRGARIFGLVIGLLAFAPAAQAAGPVDPDWPCIQRRVPHLSVAQLWAGPLPDAQTEALARQPALDALARRLALRRTALDEAEALIADFAQAAPPEQLVALFLASFHHINAARDQVLSGITRYAHKQAEIDQRIKAAREEFATAEAAQPPDYDRLDRLEREIDWTTRIFLDRQQALSYVCETPVLLEQRAFALGRAIAAHLR